MHFFSSYYIVRRNFAVSKDTMTNVFYYFMPSNEVNSLTTFRGSHDTGLTFPYVFTIMYSCESTPSYFADGVSFNTLRTGSFILFKRPLPGFLTILTL